MSKLNTSALVLSAAVAGVALGYFVRDKTERKVSPGAFYVFSDKLSDPQVGILVATGTWYGTDLAYPINTARISCDRTSRTCELHQADISRTSLLGLYSTTFVISQFDAAMVTATDESAFCVRQTLVIDRQAKSVSLLRTKTNRTEAACAFAQEVFTVSLGDPWKVQR